MGELVAAGILGAMGMLVLMSVVEHIAIRRNRRKGGTR